MARTAAAKLAGFFFLFYFAVEIPDRLLFARATAGNDVVAKLGTLTHHVPEMRIVIELAVLACYSAMILAVALYAITRDENRDIALLAMLCRVGEGITGSANVSKARSLL